jgi:thiol-disulfide isomerase/thioredoxin
MKQAVLPLLLVGAAVALPAHAADPAAEAAHPEARPFDEKADAPAQVDAAIARARASGHEAILIFGANWCGDSRALAGWFATPRFKAMLDARYEIVWIDVGQKDRNLDLARRFGLDGIKGTPTVLVVDGDGKPLNLKDAPRWNNARSRSADAIFSYFDRKGPKS